jgi:hypothetical protein
VIRDFILQQSTNKCIISDHPIWHCNLPLHRYNFKVTSVGTRHRPNTGEVKLLPCFTVYSFSAFKQRGFYYTNELIKNNSFTAEEIFDPHTLDKLRNKDNFLMTQSYSIYYGNCFTVCDLQPVSVLKMVAFEFNRNLLLKGDLSLNKESLILNIQL